MEILSKTRMNRNDKRYKKITNIDGGNSKTELYDNSHVQIVNQIKK